jgi:hypothetical protein
LQPRENAAWDPPPAFCPDCLAALNSRRLEEAIPVITQGCPNKHGLWLDQGKLRSIKQSYDSLAKSILEDDISPEKILEIVEKDNKRVFPTAEENIGSEPILAIMEKDDKPVFSAPEDDIDAEPAPKIVARDNNRVYKSNPIFRKIIFEHKGQLILVANLFLAVIVLSLFLFWTPNTPESRVISKAFMDKPSQANNLEVSNRFSTDANKGTSKQEAQQTQPNLAADKTTNTVEQAQLTQKELQDKALADRIDAYLARRGSPMAGTGAAFVAAGNATGVNPVLSVAIAGKESSFGLYCFVPHNAWGMKAPQYSNGFATWEEGIWANARHLLAYYGTVSSPYECQGYCVPDHPWMEDVATIMAAIQSS